MEDSEHKTAWEGKHLRIKICGHWEYAERPNSPAGIVIVALTPAGELLLTEQYRVPMRKNVIELPAGLSGDEQYAGEEFVETAKRELREETGYEALQWEQLTNPAPPSAGLSNEVVVFFRAKDLRRVSGGGGEGSEKIQVHHVPLSNIREWLRQKEAGGAVIDPKVYTGLYFLNTV